MAEKTLDLLSKVIGNLVKFPDEQKYRRIGADSKTFNEAVINAKGGLDFVVACGFKKKDIDGKQFWIIENPNQETLGVALALVQERISKINKKSEDELKAIEQEKERERLRVELATREFMEDRMSMEERLKYTGGTKDSVATKIRTQDEILGVKPQPIGLPNNENGGAEPEAEGEGEDDAQ